MLLTPTRKSSDCRKQYFIGSFESGANPASRPNSGPVPRSPKQIGPQAPARQYTGFHSGPSHKPPNGVDESDESIFRALSMQAGELEGDDENSIFVRVLPDFDDMWSALARIHPNSPYDPFDVRHVRDKFLGIPQDVAARLGKANSIRRRVLRYWQTHYMKLTSSPRSPPQVAPDGTFLKEVLLPPPRTPQHHQKPLKFRVRRPIKKPDSDSRIALCAEGFPQNSLRKNQYLQFCHNHRQCPSCLRFLHDISTSHR